MKSLLGKLRVIVVVMLFSILITPNLFAQEIGRYQAIALPKVQSAPNSEVFIIDTKEGHIWIWFTQSTISGVVQGGRYLIYQGNVKPGKKIGDIIEKQDFSQP
jgi:hypothetical protein